MRRRKSQCQRDHCDREMQPNVSSIIGDQPKQKRVAVDEAEHRDQTIDHAEDPEIEPRRAGARQPAPERERSGKQMHDVVRGIDVKNTEQHFVRRRGWNKTENPDQQEDDAENDGRRFQ